MIDDLVCMIPVVLALARLQIGPREVLDDPRGAHLTHHFQRTLDLPLFNLIGEASVDPHLGIDRLYRMLRAKRYALPVGADGCIGDRKDKYCNNTCKNKVWYPYFLLSDSERYVPIVE